MHRPGLPLLESAKLGRDFKNKIRTKQGFHPTALALPVIQDVNLKREKQHRSLLNLRFWFLLTAAFWESCFTLPTPPGRGWWESQVPSAPFPQLLGALHIQAMGAVLGLLACSPSFSQWHSPQGDGLLSWQLTGAVLPEDAGSPSFFKAQKYYELWITFSIS